MTKQTNLQRMVSLVLITIALLFIADIQAIAQKKNYKPGEKIEYIKSNYPEVWEEGVFVGTTPGGTQPIIRQKPNEFFKGGFETAAKWAEIRPLGTKKTIVNNEPKKEEPENTENTTETTNDLGKGLMTPEQVISFLQTKLGDKPFDNPRREEILKELAELIKQRGLDFRYSDLIADFDQKLRKFSLTSDVTFPLRDNYGAPTRQSWLMGAWNLGKIGAAVDYEKNNRVYRQGEIGVANVGTLTLNANGTYVWKSVTAQSTNGEWRKATKAEMKSQGGDGIVMLKAKSGYDWIVSKNRETKLKGEWIYISELDTRQINEYGSRGGKK